MKRVLLFLGIAQQHLLIHVMYLIGVGIPALVAKLIGKHFLNLAPKHTTWVKHKPSASDDTMY